MADTEKKPSGKTSNRPYQHVLCGQDESSTMCPGLCGYNRIPFINCIFPPRSISIIVGSYTPPLSYVSHTSCIGKLRVEVLIEGDSRRGTLSFCAAVFFSPIVSIHFDINSTCVLSAIAKRRLWTGWCIAVFTDASHCR